MWLVGVAKSITNNCYEENYTLSYYMHFLCLDRNPSADRHEREPLKYHA
ncbi:hypothetical protein SAMN04487995_5894 [Dyadobacter koreensis]|uniref:Uncharacterized protein n=1 Tax=Dyadobacter koreensis TaxID=408657 RepID=A0A1H7ASY4_9BACT|nr:hypothetical protein SAMN04487995_5894 [Dyadobacter koreensis]